MRLYQKCSLGAFNCCTSSIFSTNYSFKPFARNNSLLNDFIAYHLIHVCPHIDRVKKLLFNLPFNIPNLIIITFILIYSFYFEGV